MRKYELAVIIKDKENVEEVLNNVKALLNTNGAQITGENRWGKRELAYPIKKHTTGYYVIFTIDAPASTIKLINDKLLLNENILRHMFIKVSKKE